MSSTIAPKVMKGAIVGVDVTMPLASVCIFQYNPESLTRSIKPRYMDDNAAKSETLRLTGAPEEEIKVDIEIDATDQLASGDPIAGTFGISPQLASLELLAYPKSPLVIANTIAMLTGSIEVVPVGGPFTLFVYGPQRVLPVRVSEMTITEEMHDPKLNPIHAKVSLGLKVLSYNDLPVTHPGYYVFLAHQLLKETLGTLNSAMSIAEAVS